MRLVLINPPHPVVLKLTARFRTTPPSVSIVSAGVFPSVHWHDVRSEIPALIVAINAGNAARCGGSPRRGCAPQIQGTSWGFHTPRLRGIFLPKRKADRR